MSAALTRTPSAPRPARRKRLVSWLAKAQPLTSSAPMASTPTARMRPTYTGHDAVRCAATSSARQLPYTTAPSSKNASNRTRVAEGRGVGLDVIVRLQAQREGMERRDRFAQRGDADALVLAV